MAINFLKVLFSNGIVVIINFVNIFLFPSILGVEEYSQYQTYLLYVGYINILHLGIASGMFINYGGTEYRNTEKSQYRSEINLILIVLTFFTFMGFILSGYTKNIMFLYTTFSIYPVCMIASYKALYQAWGRFTAYSLLNVIPVIGQLLLIILLMVLRNYLNSEMMIVSYLVINYLIFIVLIMEFRIFVKGIKSKKIFSKENMVTTFNGFLITVGNYINTLIHSVGKQFVSIFFSTQNFAMYAFAISTQSVMTIFITAFSQPLYPELAKGSISKEKIKIIKEILFIFGALSGCAYFLLKFVVGNFISKYIDSIQIIRLYFLCFPAMSVINAIYLNIYKVTKQIRIYIVTLIKILIIAAVLNYFALKITNNYISIALSTTISYYIWLYYSSKHFDNIKITLKDTAYLFVFVLGYLLITFNVENEILGCAVFLMFVIGISLFFYKDTLINFVKTFKDKFKIISIMKE